MVYFKTVMDGIVMGANTLNGAGAGNIEKEEYEKIVDMFRHLPDNKVIYDSGDGSYSYIDNPSPPDPDPEIDDTELLNILMGGAE